MTPSRSVAPTLALLSCVLFGCSSSVATGTTADATPGVDGLQLQGDATELPDAGDPTDNPDSSGQPGDDVTKPANDAPEPAGDVPGPAGDVPGPAGDVPAPPGDAPAPADDVPPPTDTSGGELEVPPTEAAALFEWLQAGSYADWTAESAAHPSDGPHFGTVRTFVNAPLAGAEGGAFPVGSAAIKELYGSGDTILGWSVMVRVSDAPGGGSWWWYERYGEKVFAQSTGAGACTGCHSAAKNYVLTALPLK